MMALAVPLDEMSGCPPGCRVLGHEARLNARIVNYADDFVICCRGQADEAMTTMRAMMQKLRLPSSTAVPNGVHDV
jgi:hypothetical protein